QAADALAAANERGILHRDIKPDNLMVTGDGRLKILDFGIAKLLPTGGGPSPLGQSVEGEVTRVGALVGTPIYIAPERAAGRPVDARSDQFSLALVLYELVTGLRPFSRPTLESVLAAAIAADVRPPSLAAPDRAVPRPLEDVIMRALSADPAARYPDMRALAAALRAAMAAPEAPRRAAGRAAALAAAGGLVALAAGGAGLAVIAGSSGEGAAGDRATGAAEAPAAAIAVDEVRRLTFDPGCEEMPTFFPGGRAIVYDGVVDGDTELLRLDLATGERTRLTDRPGWDIAGTVAPDGRWIAYVHYGERGRELMVMPWSEERGAGPARALAVARGLPPWPAGGESANGDERGRVFAVAPEPGSSPRLLASIGAGVVVSQAHALDGDRVLFGARAAVAEAPIAVRLAGPDGAISTLEGAAVDSLGVVLDNARRGFYAGVIAAGGNRLRWRAIDGGGSEEVAGLPFPHGGMALSPAGDRAVLSTCRQVFQVGRLSRDGSFTPIEERRDWNDADIQPLGGGRHVVASD